jgi:hypothetical protein
MLNRWRTVEYTDDGCSVYECLTCHAQWEARTSPEHSHWRFCPVCGTHWHGALPLNRERANFGWSRKVGGVSDHQRELARLCLPKWKVFFKNAFTEGWEEDESQPFTGSAKLAASWVNRWKRPGNDPDDPHATQYRIELVKAERGFPLP